MGGHNASLADLSIAGASGKGSLGVAGAGVPGTQTGTADAGCGPDGGTGSHQLSIAHLSPEPVDRRLRGLGLLDFA